MSAAVGAESAVAQGGDLQVQLRGAHGLPSRGTQSEVQNEGDPPRAREPPPARSPHPAPPPVLPRPSLPASDLGPPRPVRRAQVYHPNIDLEGNVCLNILREDWKPVLSINSIIYGLQYLFLDPNYDDPLNKEAADLLKENARQAGCAPVLRSGFRGGGVGVGVRWALCLWLRASHLRSSPGGCPAAV